MFYTVDRIENDIAVLLDDNKNTLNVTTSLLKNACEGNVYKSDDGVVFVLDFEETQRRKNEAVSLHKSLFNKAKK